MTKEYRIRITFQGHEYLSAESFVTFDQAQKEGERRFTGHCWPPGGKERVEWMAVTIESGDKGE